MVWLAREINHCFLVNEYWDLSFFVIFLSPAITSIYKMNVNQKNKDLPFWDLLFIKDNLGLNDMAEVAEIAGQFFGCCLQNDNKY